MIAYLALDTEGQTKILGTQADAKAVNKQFTQIDIPVDKPGLLGWIQQMLDETLNAEDGPSQEFHENLCAAIEPNVMVEHQVAQRPDNTAETVAYAFEKLNYTDRSMLMDEFWDVLPMARKFHFAALAMGLGEHILAGLEKPKPVALTRTQKVAISELVAFVKDEAGTRDLTQPAEQNLEEIVSIVEPLGELDEAE